MPKLTIELIPIQSWKLSLANLMQKAEWQKIRESCYQKANWQCEICGGIGVRHKVECHEVWKFSHTEHTQLLTGFIALCPDCHSVKHIGRTFSLSNSGLQLQSIQTNLHQINTKSTYPQIGQLTHPLKFAPQNYKLVP